MLVRILNGLISVLEFIAMGVMALLPDTPFDFQNLSWGAFGQLVGFIFPVSAMFMHMSAIIASFLGYYAIRWLLRVIKQVR